MNNIDPAPPHRLSERGPLKERIRDYVVRTDYVTFAELDRHFKISGGDHSIEMRHNLILWTNMHAEASAAIVELLAEQAIHIHPSTQLVYLIDGSFPNLPIPKRMPGAGGFKTLHWLPATLRPVPMKLKNQRKRA